MPTYIVINVQNTWCKWEALAPIKIVFPNGLFLLACLLGT